MTELQFGLMGLGAVAVIGVAVYNTWQEYKHRKLAQQVLEVQHSDVLLDEPESGNSNLGQNFDEPESVPETRFVPEQPVEQFVAETPVLASAKELKERIEPVMRFDDAPAALPEPEPQPEPEVRPVNTPAENEHLPVASRLEEARESRDSVEPLHLLSPVIDYVAAFEAVEPAPAYQILESQQDALARIRKPVHWIGYNEAGREWEPIIDDGQSEYRRIRVGLQMVDRRGPLSHSELSIFHVAMQDLADELMAIADMPPRQNALDTAANLDQFCASVDIQIGINVVSGGQVFAGTKLRALAEAAGMVIDADGRFVRCDDEGNVLYVLVNQEASGFSVDTMKTMSTHGITFLLDVPRVSHGERVFNQMVDLARRFADVLRGALVDDNRRPLSEGALEPIRRQVGQYQAQMAARNLPAGGALAQRLFA